MDEINNQIELLVKTPFRPSMILEDGWYFVEIYGRKSMRWYHRKVFVNGFRNGNEITHVYLPILVDKSIIKQFSENLKIKTDESERL